MICLALDLGTCTGWATKVDGVVQSGVGVFKNDRFSGGGMRYLKFRRFLEQMSKDIKFDEVAFEEVRRHRGTDAAHVYGGLLATLTSWCEENGIAYQGIPVGTIKRHWTGKGNAPKERMIAVAVEKGFNPKDDNEADALAILDLWLTQNKSETDDTDTISLSDLWG